MSDEKLPEDLSEVRFVYKLKFNKVRDDENDLAEKEIKKLDFVVSAEWNSWQNSLMDVKCRVSLGDEVETLHWHNNAIRRVIELCGARIIE